MMAAGSLGDSAAEDLQLLGQPRAALVLGRQHGQAAGGHEGAQGMSQDEAALQHPRRGEDGDGVQAGVVQRLDGGRARLQRRELERAARGFGQGRIDGAIDGGAGGVGRVGHLDAS